MTQQCVFCHESETRTASIALDLQHGDVLIHIEGVPAQHCDTCGSDGVNGPLAEEISEGIDRITRAIEAARAVRAEV